VEKDGTLYVASKGGDSVLAIDIATAEGR